MLKQYTDISLRHMNTFGIEARAARLVEFSDQNDLAELFSDEQWNKGSGKWSVLGGGSNIIFTGDYDGTLLHPVTDSICVTTSDEKLVRVRVGAGTSWDTFVKYAATHNLWGAENLSGIPGLTGAAPVQNIGAYGVEAKNIIESVEMFSVEKLTSVKLAAEHCAFAYRDSVFKGYLKGKVVITAVNFVLHKNANPNLGYGELRDRVEALGGVTLQNIREAVLSIRNAKLPDPAVAGNAGSFFKNPIVERDMAADLKRRYPDMPLYPAQQEGFSKLAAGWLIDMCGWKGRGLGNVAVHDRQALVLVNRGGATGREVLDLAARIQADVRDKFGVILEMEVNVL